MGYDFELEGQLATVHPTHDVDGTGGPRAIAITIDGRRVEATLTPSPRECEFSLDLDGRLERVFVASDGTGHGHVHFIHFRGRTHRVEAVNALERAQADSAPSGGDEVIRAPMPGVVIETATQVGSEVEAGQLLLTIESMKLQTAIIAPSAGRVVEIGLSAGANFEQGTVLVRLESIDEETGEST